MLGPFFALSGVFSGGKKLAIDPLEKPKAIPSEDWLKSEPNYKSIRDTTMYSNQTIYVIACSGATNISISLCRLQFDSNMFWTLGKKMNQGDSWWGFTSLEQYTKLRPFRSSINYILSRLILIYNIHFIISGKDWNDTIIITSRQQYRFIISLGCARLYIFHFGLNQ